MTDQEILIKISRELRMYSTAASGVPLETPIAFVTLQDYANHLHRIAHRMDEPKGRTVEEVVAWMKKHSNVHGIAIAIFEHAVKRMDEEEDG